MEVPNELSENRRSRQTSENIKKCQRLLDTHAGSIAFEIFSGICYDAFSKNGGGYRIENSGVKAEKLEKFWEC